MSDQEFALPKSGWEVLTQILQGYFHAGGRKARETCTQSQLSHYTSLSTTQISQNNAFFLSIGVLEREGHSLKLTEEGLALALALDHKDSPSIQRALRTLYRDNEFITSVLSAVKVRDGMDHEALEKHILLSAGAPSKPKHRTGARALVESLEMAGLLTEEDGSIRFTGEEKADEEGRLESRGVASRKPRRGATVGKKGEVTTGYVGIQLSLEAEDLINEERLEAVAEGVQTLNRLLQNLDAEPDDFRDETEDEADG